MALMNIVHPIAPDMIVINNIDRLFRLEAFMNIDKLQMRPALTQALAGSIGSIFWRKIKDGVEDKNEKFNDAQLLEKVSSSKTSDDTLMARSGRHRHKRISKKVFLAAKTEALRKHNFLPDLLYFQNKRPSIPP